MTLFQFWNKVHLSNNGHIFYKKTSSKLRESFARYLTLRYPPTMPWLNTNIDCYRCLSGCHGPWHHAMIEHEHRLLLYHKVHTPNTDYQGVITNHPVPKSTLLT